MRKFERIHSTSFWETQEKITLVAIGTNGRMVWRSAL